MAVTGAAVAAAHEGGSRLKRAGMYLKAHWKELLALVLAAIPAAYIVFHKSTQQAVLAPLQSALANVPGGAGSPGTPAGPSGGGDPSTSIGSPAPVPSAGSLGTSVNGSNPVKVAAPAQSSGTVFQRVQGTSQARVTAPPPPPVQPKTIAAAFAGVPILGDVLKNFGPANIPPGTTAQSLAASQLSPSIKSVPLIGKVLGTPSPAAPPVPIKSLPLNPRRSSGNQTIQ